MKTFNLMSIISILIIILFFSVKLMTDEPQPKRDPVAPPVGSYISDESKDTIIISNIISELPEANSIHSINNSLIFENNSKYEQAIKEVKNALESNNKNYMLNLRLGWLYYQKGDFQESVKYYRSAFNISGKKSVEALLGDVYPQSYLKNWSEVEADYKSVLKLDPNNYTANLKLGQIFLYRADYVPAEKYLSKVHELYPGDYSSNLSLAYTYYYLGNNSKSKELFTNVLMLSPRDSLAIKGLMLMK